MFSAVWQLAELIKNDFPLETILQYCAFIKKKFLVFLLRESSCWSNKQKQRRVGDIQENAAGAIMYVSYSINTVISCKLARVG